MNSSEQESDKRRGYHHGSLREALVRAALHLIATKGPAGFTFADAARHSGVSSAAPYRHFRDRDALLADVARRGFEHLEAALRRAWNEGRPEPSTALKNVAMAQLVFARDEPAYYLAMFEGGIPPDADPHLDQAAAGALAVLRKACAALCAEIPAESRPPALMMSLHIWSLTHGIASLFARADAGRQKLPMTPEELLEAGMLVYLQGLGFGGCRSGR